MAKRSSLGRDSNLYVISVSFKALHFSKLSTKDGQYFLYASQSENLDSNLLWWDGACIFPKLDRFANEFREITLFKCALDCRKFCQILKSCFLKYPCNLLSCRLDYFNFDDVTLTKLVANSLSASEALEDASFNHDPHLCAKCFRLVHRVSGQNYCACLVAGNLRDNFPHKSTRLRVHASWRLIQQYNGRSSNNRHRNCKFSFITTTKCTRLLVSMIL